MPIELRRSDVVLAASQAFSKIGDFFRGVHDTEYEAERVTQVNRGLTYLETQYQQYNVDLPNKSYTTYQESNRDFLPQSSSLGESTARSQLATEGRFGQVHLEDVWRDNREFFGVQLEYINRTVTNKDALIEMQQHLSVRHLQNQDLIRRRWEEAADHEARVVLEAVTNSIIHSDTPLATKLVQINSRIDEDVRTGRLWIDEGEVLKRNAETEVVRIATEMFQEGVATAINQRKKEDALKMFEAAVRDDLEGATEENLNAVYHQIDFGIVTDIIHQRLT